MTEPLLNISDIQHFSLGDGPGIRTTVFLKGCNLRCPWCHNPETQTVLPVKLNYAGTQKTVISGNRVPVSAVAAEVLADIDFYAAGGGLTVSGGECLLDASGCRALLKAVKAGAEERGLPITTVIDTAGCVPFSAFASVDAYTDLYLIDLKTPDADAYRALGGSLPLLLENIKQLTAAGKNVRLRVPLIPGFNTAPAQLDAMARLCADVGVTRADMIPFHRLGSGKYKALGLAYAYAATPSLSLQEAAEMAERFRVLGIFTEVEK